MGFHSFGTSCLDTEIYSEALRQKLLFINQEFIQFYYFKLLTLLIIKKKTTYLKFK
jgi:hypothetical protein